MSLKSLQAMFSCPKVLKDDHTTDLEPRAVSYAATEDFLHAYGLINGFRIPDSVFFSTPGSPSNGGAPGEPLEVPGEGAPVGVGYTTSPLNPQLQPFGPTEGLDLSSPTASLAAEEIPKLYQLYHTIYGQSQDEPRPMQDKLAAFSRAGVAKILVCAVMPAKFDSEGEAIFSPPLLMVVSCPMLAWAERAGNPWNCTAAETPFLEPHTEQSWDAVVASLCQNTRNASVKEIGKREPKWYRRANVAAFPPHGTLTSLVATPSRYPDEDDPYMDERTQRCLYMSVKDARDRIRQSVDYACEALDPKNRSKEAAVVLPCCLALPADSALPVGIIGDAGLGFKNFRQLMHNQYGKHVAATLDTALIREWIELAAADPCAILMRWFHMNDGYNTWFDREAPWKKPRFYHLLMKTEYRIAGRQHIDALKHALKGTEAIEKALVQYERIAKESLEYLHQPVPTRRAARVRNQRSVRVDLPDSGQVQRPASRPPAFLHSRERPSGTVAVPAARAALQDDGQNVSAHHRKEQGALRPGCGRG